MLSYGYLWQILCDNDPSVMTASLCALFDLISGEIDAYKNLTSSFVSILKQVVEHRLPKPYNYHGAPAPFIQVCSYKSVLTLLPTTLKLWLSSTSIIFIADKITENSGLTWSWGQENE